MYEYPIETIKAPAYLFIGGSCFYMKDSISVQKVSERSDVALSNSIKAGEILTSQRIQIKGTPVAFSNATALFAELSLAKGSLLPKTSNCYIVARVASGSWVKWSFAPAIHEAIGSISFGSDSPMGEHTWTVYADPLNPTTPLVQSTTLQTPPTFPALTSAGKFMLRCLGIYGTGEDAIDFDTDGASIDISISTEDAQNDRLLKYGKILTDISVTAKFKPRNISLADWQTLTGILESDEIGSFSGVGTLPDLVLRGAKAGDFAFTLKSARISDPQAKFGAGEALMDELSFEALGDATGDNKLTIGTASADYSFDDDE